MKAVVVAAIITSIAAADLSLSWSDCGGGSTHAKINSFTPSTLTLGKQTRMTGIGALDEAVSGATFDMTMTGAIGQLLHCTGDASTSKTCNLPLGTGTLTFDGMSFPLAAGSVPVNVDIKLGSSVPTSLQTTTTTCKATASNGDALFCIEIKSAPATNVHPERAAQEEGRRYSKGYKRMTPTANDLPLIIANISAEDLAATPSAIDWSAKGALTPINEQGDCGSCWAFSTMETVESAVFISTGRLPKPLSVQQLVACDSRDAGCDGGDPEAAVRYLKNAGGMDTASDYPDTSSKSGRSGKCKWDKESAVTVSGYQLAVPQCTHGRKTCTTDEDKLAAALAKYGPLSISINSGDKQACDWMKYKGGVLKPKCQAKPNLIDHSVQLVGFDKTATTPYWKVRNSWGKSWGENGFIRLPMGENSCCIGCEALIISATAKSEAVIV